MAALLAAEPVCPQRLPADDMLAAKEDSDVEDDVEGRHQFSAEETLIIFDWDDTVMPSSWVMEEGLSLEGEDFTPEQQAKLSELARLATQTLTLAMRLGTVLLVTNAEHGW
ncbi:URA1, partial [Symbiodinium necroappetens]